MYILKLTRLLSFLFLVSLARPAVARQANKTRHADVIVYGGTSAGIIAAVQVAKMGKKVIVVSPDVHLGGLSSSGLGFTDTGNKEVIGGLARDFYHRVYLHYQQDSAWKWQSRESYGNKGQGTPAIDGRERTMWIFEPHVAESIFETLVKENKITVYRDRWLDRTYEPVKKKGSIVGIKTTNGEYYTGSMFIDATYEGDLMAAAKVNYHIGREANAVYGEKWNGVQALVFQHRHHFAKPVDPFVVKGNPASGLLPGISKEVPGPNGSADKRLQAYCYRMCLSDKPENRVEFPKPDNYNPTDYELLVRVFESGWRELFDKYDPVPNRKTDTNNHGPFSTDYIGMNYRYPEASYAERKSIIKAHEDYQKGLMYFLSNDPRVPADLQARMKTWGLAKDEFADNGHWPYQLYVREARRMIGPYVVTEHDVLGTKEVPRPVGMGSYSLDSHNVQRYVTPEGHVQNEGDIGVKAPKPYAISYDALVPKAAECKNLLVPVCLSSSHIAYGSIRMEPVFMILGQSAATAAVLAINNKVSVQDVDYKQLAAALQADKQCLTYK
ncbi:xanthan lyase [Pedobacter yulinensis]|uniref:Xanthan lyase n=1 Tax=Pedobacter yulinensis TaxID=2126353 RepID=A0A2T3HJ86_9SPHI|nr:FAD-dependent oxidoreductase [Pedobacter yulinensis]PST82516.1 xanthan lyase [Pedobacter yulinensis]